MIFVQARSSTDHFQGDPLLQEFGKYSALPRTHKYMKYLDALGLNKRIDGAGFLYAVLMNSDFQLSAQQNAAKFGLLLRSRRQLAHFIANAFSINQLLQLQSVMTLPEKGDLTTNLAIAIAAQPA